MLPASITTPTSLPANPAILTTMDITTSLLIGGAAVILIFLIFSIYLAVNRKWR